jgi:expansin (peptidoglycan-binding protein)
MRSVSLLVLVLAFGCAEERPSLRDGTLPPADGPKHTNDTKKIGDLANDGPRPEQGVAHDKGTTFDQASPTPDQTPKPNPFPVVNGKATYYDADGSGNCSFPASPQDLMVAALNTPDYNGSQSCGACVKVKGPSGTVTVRIVDRCPECNQGHIDLSKEAFAKIAAIKLGVVQVTWQFVPCPVQGPIRYQFKSGSNQWWTAIQIRNHRYPIKKLEGQIGGSFKTLPREMYNYFVASNPGMGPGPYTFRVTDVLGHVLTDTGIPLKVGQEVAGKAQFPP